jgi:hypothetical protein
MTNTNRDLVELAVKDFFTKKMLSIAMMPLMIAIVFLVIFLSFFAASFFEWLGSYFMIDGEGWLVMLFANTIVQSISSVIFYLLSSGVVILLSVIVGLIVVGFLTPQIIKTVRDRHYGAFELREYGTFSGTLFYYGKVLVIFLVILIVLMPLYFFPIVNMIVINIPFFYLFYKMLLRDVSTAVNSKKEAQVIIKENRSKLFTISVVLYGFSLLPFIGVFLSTFFIIYLGHFFIRESLELRVVKDLR